MLELDSLKQVESILNQGSFKELIVKLNTDKQLLEEGVDSDGKSLGKYTSPSYKKLKSRKGIPSDHVNLFLTGKLHNSFEALVSKNGVTIKADTKKGDWDLVLRWGEKIVGLTKDSLGILIKDLRNEILEEDRKQLRIL